MKPATFRDNSRNDQLAVVSHDLKTAHFTAHIAGTLQRALDGWAFHVSQLQDLYNRLNTGRARHPFTFDAVNYMASLLHAYQWANDSAYLNHVELARRTRGAEIPPEFWADPLMYQDGSDDLAGARDPIVCHGEAFGIDFEAEMAVITGDVPMSTEAVVAIEDIRLVVLVDNVSLRNLTPAELDKGFGFFQSKPVTSFSPVAVTPDELGDAWRERKVHLPMTVRWNNKEVGQPEYGTNIAFGFGQLIAYIYKIRSVRVDGIVGSGTISNMDRSEGYACIAEKRMLGAIESGAPVTEYVRYNGTVKVEMFDVNGVSIFGAVDQEVVAPGTQA